MQKIKVIDYIDDIPFRGVRLGNRFRDNIAIRNNGNNYYVTIEVDLTDADISTIDNRVVVEPGTKVLHNRKVVVLRKFISGYASTNKMRDIIRRGYEFRYNSTYKSYDNELGDNSPKITYSRVQKYRFNYISKYGDIVEPETERHLGSLDQRTLCRYYNNIKVLNYTAWLNVIDGYGRRVRYPITFEIPEDEILAIINNKQNVIRREGALYKEPYQRKSSATMWYVLPFEIKVDYGLRKDITKIYRLLTIKSKLIRGFVQKNKAGSSTINDGVCGAVFNGNNYGYARKTPTRIRESSNLFDDIIKVIENSK